MLLAFQMAMASDLVRADMVEVVEFPHLANLYQVMGVPRTVINEEIHIEGAVPEPMLVREMGKLLDGAGNDHHPKAKTDSGKDF